MEHHVSLLDSFQDKLPTNIVFYRYSKLAARVRGNEYLPRLTRSSPPNYKYRRQVNGMSLPTRDMHALTRTSSSLNPI